MPRTSSQNGIDLSTPFPMEILIVGAGLGGLATSIALARRGHKITLLEQASQLSEVSQSRRPLTESIQSYVLRL